jgi:predicted RNA polymerase sigma factor
MVHGTEAGLQELSRLKDHPSLQKYHLLPATFGELYERNGEFESARRSYCEALKLTVNEVERRFLERKLSGLGAKT